jgi:hypothetical protein
LRRLLAFADINPFDKVKPLDVPDRGHVPWPTWAIDVVAAKAPPDLVRLVRLSLMTCQRESDLIRMGPEHRQGPGIWCRPQKTRRRRRSFLIPLATVDAVELDRLAAAPMDFHHGRWAPHRAPLRDDFTSIPRLATPTPRPR